MLVITPAPAQENTAAPQANVFQTSAKVLDTNLLLAGEQKFALWGLNDSMPLPPRLKARAWNALEDLTAQGPLTCEILGRDGALAEAQCTNTQNIDIGLRIIQEGFASVDREDVIGSALEDPYIEAEKNARQRELGMWSYGEDAQSSEAGGHTTFVAVLMFFVFLLVAFGILSALIMKGFQRVIDAQAENVDIMNRERRIRDKERMIIAMLLDSELKANKSKIEAYLVVYEEMLRSMKAPDREAKYKSAGDIVQKQPILDRVVFDRNTDKLDVLGRKLASSLVHFYARIKTEPEYINLEPDLPEKDAIAIVEKALDNARNLNNMAEDLLKSFEASGIAAGRVDLGDGEGSGS